MDRNGSEGEWRTAAGQLAKMPDVGVFPASPALGTRRCRAATQSVYGLGKAGRDSHVVLAGQLLLARHTEDPVPFNSWLQDGSACFPAAPVKLRCWA